MTDREAALRAWSECTVLLQAMIQPEAYNAWFPHIKPVSLIGVEMTLGVPSQFFCEYIETHFINELKQVLQRIVGPNVVLKYKALVDSAASHRKNSSVTLPTQSYASNAYGAASAYAVSASGAAPALRTEPRELPDFDSQESPIAPPAPSHALSPRSLDKVPSIPALSMVLRGLVRRTFATPSDCGSESFTLS